MHDLGGETEESEATKSGLNNTESPSHRSMVDPHSCESIMTPHST